METFLMDFCLNFLRTVCDERVRNATILTQLREDEPLLILLTRKERGTLDEVCKRCDHRFFSIQKKQCLVCGSLEFQKEAAGASLKDAQNILKKEIVFMECASCQTRLQYIIEH